MDVGGVSGEKDISTAVVARLKIVHVKRRHPFRRMDSHLDPGIVQRVFKILQRKLPLDFFALLRVKRNNDAGKLLVNGARKTTSPP